MAKTVKQKVNAKNALKPVKEINDFALKRNLGNNLDLDFLKRAFKKTHD